MEEIEPGTPLLDSGTYPALSEVAQLLTALHTQGTPDLAFPSVADRVAYLFASWARPRQSDPTLVALVPPELFDRGRRLALRLAEEPSPTVLLHGDFTPVNILDGGERRGLVAIDPAPCLGDPAFDAIDLLFWQVGDLDTISRRAELLAPAIGVDATRLLDWCTAFAGMAAGDLGGTGQRAEPPGTTGVNASGTPSALPPRRRRLSEKARGREWGPWIGPPLRIGSARRSTQSDRSRWRTSDPGRRPEFDKVFSIVLRRAIMQSLE